MTTDTLAKLAARICLDVAELGDRNSPEDWPEAMLVTSDELRDIVLSALTAQALPAAEPVNLWCIHIPGPDELHAAPSVEAAVHMKQRHNAAMQEHFERHPDPDGMGPLRESCLAEVRAWPWSALSHAAALEAFDAKAWGWPTAQAQAPTEPTLRCIACAMRERAIGQLPDQSVTPAYLEWLDTRSRSAGVAGNEAWNAGVAWKAAQAPAGWVMVPKVATQPMCEAAHYGPQCAEDHMTDKDMEWLREMWAAMLSALLQPPQPQSAQGDAA